MYHEGIEYGESVSEEISVGVEASISGGFLFGEASVSTSVSSSMASEWSRAKTKGQDITVGCDFYDDGTEFKKGCLWSFHMETHDTRRNNMALKWDAMITRCTKSRDPPKCPPFTRCVD